MAKVLAVVVTYQPDKVLLSKLMQALAPQVAGGIVVNNGQNLPLPDTFVDQAGFAVRHMITNVGVATALNVGFQWAQAQAAEFVITFDQDSEPAPDMVSCLVDAYQTLVASGHNVGAVGPQQIDSRTGHLSPFISPISLLRRKVIPANGECLAVDHLITSGCLVPMHVWAMAGRFLDELFIDYVDIEWSLRLRRQGWQLFGVGNAKLMHAIGDDVTSWRGRQILQHTPLRHYFMFRNGIYLQSLSHISFGWKLADAFQLFKKMLLFILAGHPRCTHFRAMLRGLRDGWQKHMGQPWGQP